jgi:hypothetical protein
MPGIAPLETRCMPSRTHVCCPGESGRSVPLYTFTGDQKPGETKGQGIKDVGTWSVVTTSASSTPSSAGGSAEPEKSSGGSSGEGSSSGYGY